MKHALASYGFSLLTSALALSSQAQAQQAVRPTDGRHLHAFQIGLSTLGSPAVADTLLNDLQTNFYRYGDNGLPARKQTIADSNTVFQTYLAAVPENKIQIIVRSAAQPSDIRRNTYLLAWNKDKNYKTVSGFETIQTRPASPDLLIEHESQYAYADSGYRQVVDVVRIGPPSRPGQINPTNRIVGKCNFSADGGRDCVVSHITSLPQGGQQIVQKTPHGIVTSLHRNNPLHTDEPVVDTTRATHQRFQANIIQAIGQNLYDTAIKPVMGRVDRPVRRP